MTLVWAVWRSDKCIPAVISWGSQRGAWPKFVEASLGRSCQNGAFLGLEMGGSQRGLWGREAFGGCGRAEAKPWERQ